jgi:hypothetical protein
LTSALLLPQQFRGQEDGSLFLKVYSAAYEGDLPLLLIHLGMKEALPV